MEIINEKSEHFQEYKSKLLLATSSNPVYLEIFSSYYSELSRNKEFDASEIVVDNGIPVLGIIRTIETKNESKHFKYYNLPALLLSNILVDEKLVHTASILLFKHLFQNSVSSTDNHLKGIISLNYCNLNHKLAKYLLSKSKMIGVNLESRIDLKIDLSELINSSSKSIKLAANNFNKRSDLSVEFIKSDSSIKKINESFAILQELHYESAGRLTRTQSSWEIQKKWIYDGHALLVIGRKLERPIHASLFLISDGIAYYGVSANRLAELGPISANSFIIKAIGHIKNEKIKYLYMGQQYSRQKGVLDEKLESIEKNKRLFDLEFIPKIEVKF